MVCLPVLQHGTWHQELDQYQYLAVLLWGMSYMMQKVVTACIEYTVVPLE